MLPYLSAFIASAPRLLGLRALVVQHLSLVNFALLTQGHGLLCGVGRR